MFNIAICDDDKAICSQLENILLNYSSNNHFKIEISVFYSGESLLHFLNKGNFFELIFLDIEMGQINGIKVGNHIRKVLKNYTSEIIFISNHDSYDRQLFDYQPLHFISKPIKSDIVIDDLKLALKHHGRVTGSFRYQKSHNTHKVSINDIIYFESLNREIKILTTRENDFFYGRLEEVKSNVSKYLFFHIHRSYLINCNHIKILRYSEVVMSNGDTIPISRAKRQQFRNFQLDEVCGGVIETFN